MIIRKFLYMWQVICYRTLIDIITADLIVTCSSFVL